MRNELLVATILSLAFCAVAFPLATYTLSLAAFGLYHVIAELNYVKVRFGSRIKTRLAATLIALLMLVVFIRLALIGGWVSLSRAHLLEVTCIILLSVSVVPSITARRSSLVFGLLGASLLSLGLLISPTYTLLALAVAHNWTPVGFIAEATAGTTRMRALVICTIVFLVCPLVIATGIPFSLLSHVGLALPEASPLPVGQLVDHLGVYLPVFLQQESYALNAFSAIVFAQCIHYVAVIHVLPRLAATNNQQKRVANDRVSILGLPATFVAITVCAILFIWFCWDFKQARAVYGVAAAVHAWIEIPILLLALAPFQPPQKQAHAERRGISYKGDQEASAES